MIETVNNDESVLVLHIYHIYTLSVEGRLLCIYEYMFFECMSWGGVTRVVAFFISVSGDVDVIFVRGVYMYNTS